MRLSPVLLLAACGPQYLAVGEGPAPLEGLPDDYANAARQTGVPVEILLAVAQAETRMEMVAGDAEFPGQEPAFGVMALRGATLQHAADLAGLDADEVRTVRSANVSAAAHLLQQYAIEERVVTDDLAAWAPVVARFAGTDEEEAVRGYVHHAVYGALREGILTEEVALAPIEVAADWPLPSSDLDRGVDGGAIWSASPNWNSRGGQPVDFVVVHTCEGSYSGCWGWLTNAAAQASAHYVVNENGSEVRALVDEANRAWHVAADYDANLNGGADAWWQGWSVNTISVGIEHAGYASQTWWDPGLLQRSAELTCGITQRHGIPRDGYHVVGHGQLQPWDRTDPGASWPWADYLWRVQAACGDLGGTTGGGEWVPPGPFVIDSNNDANDTSWFLTEVSPSWWGSANVGGYWNTGYWVAPTAAVSDPASFWFWLDGDACYDVEAWWTSASDRSRAITFMGWRDDGSEVGRATVNQRRDGGRWNHLGSWRFGWGWNRVLMSRWTTPGAYAVADAVRLTPSSSCP